jgi:hypothetical protein
MARQSVSLEKKDNEESFLPLGILHPLVFSIPSVEFAILKSAAQKTGRCAESDAECFSFARLDQLLSVYIPVRLRKTPQSFSREF